MGVAIMKHMRLQARVLYRAHALTGMHGRRVVDVDYRIQDIHVGLKCKPVNYL